MISSIFCCTVAYHTLLETDIAPYHTTGKFPYNKACQGSLNIGVKSHTMCLGQLSDLLALGEPHYISLFGPEVSDRV